MTSKLYARLAIIAAAVVTLAGCGSATSVSPEPSRNAQMNQLWAAASAEVQVGTCQAWAGNPKLVDRETTSGAKPAWGAGVTAQMAEDFYRAACN